MPSGKIKVAALALFTKCLGVCLWCAQGAAASNVPSDTIHIADINHCNIAADIHVRTDASDWKLVWDYTSPGNYIVADINRQHSNHDNYTASVTSVTIERHISGSVQKLFARTFTDHSRAFSVYLSRRSSGTKLLLGDGTPVDCPALAACHAPDSSSVILIHPAQPKPVELTAALVPVLAYPPVYYTRSKADSLKTGNDHIQGTWQYLDRDIDRTKVILDRKYTLFIVPDRDNGGYLLLTPDHHGDPSLLLLKGRMQPTAFKDNYNLTWYDTKHDDAGQRNEAYATVTESIITFTFPLLNSSFRVSRILSTH